MEGLGLDRQDGVCMCGVFESVCEWVRERSLLNMNTDNNRMLGDKGRGRNTQPTAAI